MEIEKYYEIYNMMIKIRLVEDAIVKEYPLQQIKTPVHLYIGQEAVAAGVTANLDKKDFIVSNHRCHGHCLAKGMDLIGFFMELYGKEGGVSSGRGGSMHLCDMELGIVGTSAIVAGGIPIGAGVALKQQIKKEPWITVIYFGDGAVDEGVFWETINFAGLKKLPVLFVMENNNFASQTAADLRHSYKEIVNITSGFCIPSYKVDGNDAVQVYKTSRELIENIRAGNGPAFLECLTYRWMGHVGTTDDSSTGYRTSEEVAKWRGKCPVVQMENYLQKKDGKNAVRRINEIKEIWQERISEAVNSAKEAPYAMD